jgi:hypothetical protein
MKSGILLANPLTFEDLLNGLTHYQDMVDLALERKIEREEPLRNVGLKAGEVSISINEDDGAKGWDRIKGEVFSPRLNTDQNTDEISGRTRKRGGTRRSEPAEMPWGSFVFRFSDLDGSEVMTSSPRPA